MGCDVSIIIPVLNKLEFTRQCLDSIRRHTDDAVSYEVIVVDNGSTDGTAEWMVGSTPIPVRYHRNATNLGFSKANNIGARIATGTWLLFLNNDTLARAGWLTEMVRIPRTDPSVGIVGIKQLFPYTNTIYHTGIVFTNEGRPEHLYPHLDASLPQVNKQREYPAVTGACLLIDRALFDSCGGFDEEYRNGYEDVDLCMQARERGRKIVCCTKSYIFHYGQISEGRTADDDANAARFARKWAGKIKPDRDDYLIRDRADSRAPAPKTVARRTLADDCIYLADALDDGSALTWINAELALALDARGAAVFVNGAAAFSPTLSADSRRALASIALKEPPVGGVQVKWSHYRPQHLNLDLAGSTNLELFVINYLFDSTTAEPWDYWLQCLRQDGYEKLPLSEFCDQVLDQIGVPQQQRHVWYPGYSREIAGVEAPRRPDARFRFLTVTNSHDLERYNTAALIDAFQQAFTAGDETVLTIKDYGASSGDATIRRRLNERSGGPRIEYIGEFQEKRALIELYKSSDAFVSAHRGEGFGMKILDAMACGVPVVAPLFGGSTAYCTPDNSFPVDFSLVPMGRCLDTQSLHIANRPIWAEVKTAHLVEQLRAVHRDRATSRAKADAGRAAVEQRFSWDSAAARLQDIVATIGRRSPARTPTSAPAPAKAERSPYWLGLRVSVVIPTHNRKEKLMACLEALARQSVLPQEFEVIVVDDGSTDGTREALADRRFPFALRYVRQEPSGPGAARNLAIAQAAGELVLFIGDDILADERLLEEHLLAHASKPDAGVAILGHIDWPPSMPMNAVMDYVCGDAMLQFAYTYIPGAAALDHRFFYTSNISLKRAFLTDAAAAGIAFDPAFRRAAFEDSEFALRLMPRGLRIQYEAGARVYHDHWMDLASFSAREFGAGQMAVVFYRKHPGQDPQLLVRWIADLVEPASALRAGTDGFLARLESFDEQTDVLLRSLAGSLEQLLAIEGRPASGPPITLSAGRLRAALHNVLRTIFDVQRTRGKIEEWFLNVDDPARVRAAQTLASVMRKIEFLNVDAEALGPLQGAVLPIDRGAVADLSGRLAAVEGMAALSAERAGGPVPQGIKRRLRRLFVNPFLLSRARQADRFIEARFRSWNRERWLEHYRRVRRRIRDMV